MASSVGMKKEMMGATGSPDGRQAIFRSVCVLFDIMQWITP